MYLPLVQETVLQSREKREKVYLCPFRIIDIGHSRAIAGKWMKRHQTLLGTGDGAWQNTEANFESRLSVSTTELLVAGLHDFDICVRFPEPQCFSKP